VFMTPELAFSIKSLSISLTDTQGISSAPVQCVALLAANSLLSGLSSASLVSVIFHTEVVK